MGGLEGATSSLPELIRRNLETRVQKCRILGRRLLEKRSIHIEGDADKWETNGINGVGKKVEVKDVTDAVREIVGDDGDGDWIDEEEGGVGKTIGKLSLKRYVSPF